MTGLEKIFNVVKEELYKEQRFLINKWFHNELKELDKDNIPYNIYIGYYDYDGFNIDRQLNSDTIDGLMIDDGFDFVEYLKHYYDKKDYSAVCQLQVRLSTDNIDFDKINELGYDIVFIEYDGYQLYEGTF
jgi:hypothetical protein